MSNRARRINNTAAVRLCAAALAALLLAPPVAVEHAACGLGVVFGDGVVFADGAVMGDGVILRAGVVFGDIVTRGDNAAQAAAALADGDC